MVVSSPRCQAHSCPLLPLPRLCGHTLPWAITAGDKHSCTSPFPAVYHPHKLHQVQRRSYHSSATDPNVMLAKLPNTAVPQFPFLEAGTCLRGILGDFVLGKDESSG